MAGKRKSSRPKAAAAERELIAGIRRRADKLLMGQRKSGILTLGIGDDCAVLQPRRAKEIGGYHGSLTRKCALPAGLASTAKRGPSLPGTRIERSGGHGGSSRGSLFVAGPAFGAYRRVDGWLLRRIHGSGEALSGTLGRRRYGQIADRGCRYRFAGKCRAGKSSSALECPSWGFDLCHGRPGRVCSGVERSRAEASATLLAKTNCGTRIYIRSPGCLRAAS